MNENIDKDTIEWIQRVEVLCEKIGYRKDSEFQMGDDKIGLRIRSSKNLLSKLNVLKNLSEVIYKLFLIYTH